MKAKRGVEEKKSFGNEQDRVEGWQIDERDIDL
jgi:hypothetical protein